MFLTFWRDLRHGVRMLAKNPGFALIAIGSIAIGVGVNAAMFSMADGLLLRPLQIPRAGDVVSVVGIRQENAFRFPAASYPDYVDIRDRARSFSGLVAYREIVTGFDARPDRPAQRTLGSAVSGNYFDAMEIRPALGRFFRADEDRVPGRDAVVVLDHRTWTERFGADPAILGRRIRITNTDFTVVGVAPASFVGLAQDVWPSFYVPLAMVGETQSPPTAELTRRDLRAVRVKGRLKPEATLVQARQEVAGIASDLERLHPATNKGQGMTVVTEWTLRSVGPDSGLVAMLLALAVAVLLAACANVAGLLTSRAPLRGREIALRLAIGAGRASVVRQLLTESLLVAAAGGAVGLLIAYGGILLFRQIEFPVEVPLKLTFELDNRVLVLAILVAAASVVLSSLIPAWQTTRTDLVSVIKGSTTAPRRLRQWGRQSLVCVQVALSMVLLTVAAALYQGFEARLAAGPGYRTDDIFMMRFAPQLIRYDGDQTREFYELLKDRTRALPGVTAVALTSSVPMKTDTSDGERIIPEEIQLPAGVDSVGVRSSRVDEDFFETIGIPVVRGRAFTAADGPSAPRVAIVNEVLAARYWPGQGAVGKRFRLVDDDGTRPLVEIVGVAATAKYDWLAETPQAFLYLPRMQHAAAESTLLVATVGDAAALAGPVREAAQVIAPAMPMFSARTMANLYEARAVRISSLIVRLVGAMGSMGLGLTLVGLYGLVAYAVSRRTREIGIRMAVGAAPGAILAMVLQRGVALTVVGITIGAIASLASSRLLEAAIPGVGDFAVGTYLLVVPLVFAVTLFAAYLPARRAARIDPLLTLRAE